MVVTIKNKNINHVSQTNKTLLHYFIILYLVLRTKMYVSESTVKYWPHRPFQKNVQIKIQNRYRVILLQRNPK